MMAFIGVRSSWLTDARNSLFRRFARSSCRLLSFSSLTRSAFSFATLTRRAMVRRARASVSVISRGRLKYAESSPAARPRADRGMCSRADARPEVAGFDVLGGGGEIFEWARHRRGRAIGEERDERDEAGGEDEQYDEQGPLRGVECVERQQHGEHPGLRHLRPHDLEDAVVALSIEGHVLDEDIARGIVDLLDGWEDRVLGDRRGRRADFPVPDQRELG